MGWWQSFVVGLNMISSQPWGILVIVIGAVLLVLCKHFGIDTTIAGGVIGVGGNMLQATVSKSHTDADKTKQDTGTPVPPTG